MSTTPDVCNWLRGRPGGRAVARIVARPLSVLSFWLAIALPALYLPLLAAGIDSESGLAGFLALLGLHVAALLGGRSHAVETGR